jgi:hypothetical protein
MKSIPVETKTCRHCSADFSITAQDLEFYTVISPVFSGVKSQIPTPTLCPDCRQQRRLSFRNERNLYRRNCDATGKSIISVFSPDKPFKVYHQDFWWSDAWNPLDYGRDFDFNRPFFEQLAELMKEVPRVAIINKNSENSDYTHISAFNKDCYLLVESSNNESCLCGYWLQQTKESADCSFLNACERCYSTMDSDHCFELLFSQNCENCSRSVLLDDCVNCTDCIACVGLVNQKYAILNEVCTKERYEEVKKSLFQDAGAFKAMKARYEALLKTTPRKYAHILNSSNCVGDYVKNAENARNCYEIHDAKDTAYAVHVWFDSHDCFDVDTVGYRSSFIYESINTAIDSTGNVFCNRCWTISQSALSNECDNSSHIFGCIGLRNKEYCILNKQYTKEEYEALVPKIIEHMRGTGEWGEFFPSSISPFGYNETVAQEYYPLTREEILGVGSEARSGSSERRPPQASGRGLAEQGSFRTGPTFAWSDYEPPFPKVEKTIPAAKLPERIEDVPDDILNWAIECEVTKKPFRIIKQELEFYRKHHLPIPKRHPDQRHLDRMALRNPRKLFERTCDKCGTDMVTTYAPDRSETIYCEKCYAKEVLG